MVRILDRPVAIISAARTPVGRFDGILAPYDAVELGAGAIEGAIQRSGLSPDEIDTATMGFVVSAGYGEAPAKEAALRAGIPETVHARSVDSVCGSAMDAIAISAELLLAGAAEVAVAGGMESRSNAPYLLGPRFWKSGSGYQRGGRVKVKRAGAYRFAFSEDIEEQLRLVEMKDSTAYDGLFWVREKKFMREYALDFAKKMGYAVEQVNEYAAESHRKAWEAARTGAFADEIVPVGEAVHDELISEEKQQQIVAENPDDIASAFNASAPADGGAAIIMATRETAERLNAPMMARILGYARTDGPAPDFLHRPVDAVNELRAGLAKAGDSGPFDIIEANEAFGVQLPLFFEAFSLMKINVHGGAIALGHPFGAAGARILTTLLYAMKRYNHRRGLAAICFASGGGYAMAVEREESR